MEVQFQWLIRLITIVLLTHFTYTYHSCQAVKTFEKSHKVHKRSAFDSSAEIDLSRKKRDGENSCPDLPDYQSKLDAHHNIHYFRNDSHPSIALTWSGDNGVILALTTMSSNGFVIKPSQLYRSTNRGKSFQEISSKINHDIIRKRNGMQVSPVDTSHVVLLSFNSPYRLAASTNVYATRDAGANFQKSVAAFDVDDQTIKFNFHEKYRVLALSKDHSLWITKDFCASWTRIAQYVLSASWDPINADVLYYTTDPQHKMLSGGMENELSRFNVHSNTADLLAQHVHSFSVQDHFLFLSVQFSGKNGSRVMHVSNNEGRSWNAAQLPLINSDQFYSLLDMSEDMVFVHVDLPGDTGHGNIYTSDERGIIFSLSLERHLYPNNRGITDFYKVNSLPGVYITTQLAEDLTVHSRITFDKGGTWQPITRPEGSKCPPTEKVCNLQIHNFYSASKGVRLPSLPLSSKSTVGLVVAHGNLGDGLNVHEPSVFISDDGGYTWKQPSLLKGPHFYGIADSGGILFAIPASAGLVDTLMFSVDEGQCWHSYTFSPTKIHVTGVSIEPGEKATDVSIWGWESEGDHSWMAITVDFHAVLGQACTNSDFMTWNAHESNTVANLNNNCLLGAQRTYIRRKKGSVCINGNQLIPTETQTPCPCQIDDFLCDYGYKRGTKNKCIPDDGASTSNRDVCINDQEELITTQGYRKIPGDLCQGGEQFPRNIQNLHKSCAKAEEAKDDFGVDKKNFEEYSHSPPHTSPHTGIIVFLVIAVLTLGCMLAYLLYKKRTSFLRVRYTPLSTKEPAENGTATTSLFDDDTSLLVDEKQTSNHGAVSYHDDSDDDLMVS